MSLSSKWHLEGTPVASALPTIVSLHSCNKNELSIHVTHYQKIPFQPCYLWSLFMRAVCQDMASLSTNKGKEETA